MSNPLLDDSTLPTFSAIKNEHILPAVEKQLDESREYVEQLLQQDIDVDWHNFVAPIAEQGDILSRLWSPVSHMNSVVNSEELRKQHDACLPLLSKYAAEFGQNKPLYDCYAKIAQRNDLTEKQRKILEDELLDFKMAGVDLEEKQQQRFREIKSRLSDLGSVFSNHVLDATMAWSKEFKDVDGLDGLPESALSAAKESAKEKGLDGYLISLEIPSYLAVMTYANDKNLRKEVYRAYCTRASNQQPEYPDWDNAPIIKETLALRHELSQLLGYNNYAEYSLTRKMADSPEQVIDFLEQLAGYSYEKAKQELSELAEFAKQQDNNVALETWDVAYYSEKLRQEKYDISEEALRPWFPEDQVLDGLFEITQKLYGVSFNERKDVDIWHKDVRFFDIYDNKNQQLGSFYFDLYARSNKRGGAWMDSCRDRMLSEDGTLQLPVAYLTCNFNAPIGDATALFTHDEVVTLFHEFGHGLHHLMTEIDEVQISGINGVAWDAVELPSQFMENFCYDKESLSLIARHYETHEPLSDEVLQKLNDARQFQAAMQMVRQLEFSLFDFKIHLQYQPDNEDQYAEILKLVRTQVSTLPPPEWNRFENGFSHIFAGGYAAGYYSYKWAEVLSADAWSYFEEQGIFNKDAGELFLKEIISQGGSKKAMELFVNFRGRKPSVEPLLKQQGISVEAA